MRIGIVSDVAAALDAMRRAVSLEPDHRVVWSATSGAEAVDLCHKQVPDLVLMDLMTGTDGVDATRRIMSGAPCPILIVTDSVHGNAARIFDAMGYGALDAVDAPALSTGDLPDGALRTKIARISRLVGEKTAPNGASAISLSPREEVPLVAIGASAGGPAAVATVLSGLPKDFAAAVVIIQHVDAQFAPGMANWLSHHSALPVVTARGGERLEAGTVMLAGTTDHLTLKAPGELGDTRDPANCPYRPSVDVFFESVCRVCTGRAVGVLLTGMGNDGAAGLRMLRVKGFHTIAQDEATSAVFGMPKAAVTLEAAVEILPLERIASRLAHLIPKPLRLLQRREN
jgi:two-component system, chemotaxis family, response regulator WspF